jgi:DNA-binding transcriptional ArsR family regulator
MDAMQDLVFERIAEFFALLSDPMRIRIIHCLCDGERTVTDIVAQTKGTQTNISRHLGQLYRAGLLSRTKNGNFILYRVADPAVLTLCRTVCVQVAGMQDLAVAPKRKLLGIAQDFARSVD